MPSACVIALKGERIARVHGPTPLISVQLDSAVEGDRPRAIGDAGRDGATPDTVATAHHTPPDVFDYQQSAMGASAAGLGDSRHHHGIAGNGVNALSARRRPRRFPVMPVPL